MNISNIHKIIRSIEAQQNNAKRFEREQEELSSFVEPLKEQEDKIKKACEPYMRIKDYVDEENKKNAELLGAVMVSEDAKLAPYGKIALIGLVGVLLSAQYVPQVLPYITGGLVLVVSVGVILKFRYDSEIYKLARKIDLSKEANK